MKPFLEVLAVCSTAAFAGCDVVTFSSKVDCDELSSEKWKSDPEARTYEFAEAIDRCGVLDGKSRAGIEEWMGESELFSGNREMGWVLTAEDDEDDTLSDFPMVTLTKDRNGEFTRFNISRP